MARGIGVLGDPWCLLVLRELFYGNGRFAHMRDKLAVADSVLSKRLADLSAEGLITQTPYDDGGRQRWEYSLTDSGADTLPILNAMLLWSEKHLPAPAANAHMTVIHDACGNECSLPDFCTHCGEVLTAENTLWHNYARTAEPAALTGAVRGAAHGAKQ